MITAKILEIKPRSTNAGDNTESYVIEFELPSRSETFETEPISADEYDRKAAVTAIETVVEDDTEIQTTVRVQFPTDRAETVPNSFRETILRVLKTAGIVGLLLVSISLFDISPISLLTDRSVDLTVLFTIVLIIVTLSLYWAKYGTQLSPSLNLNGVRSPASTFPKIALVVGGLAVLIIGASSVGLPTGSLPFIGGGQSDLVIQTPGNNETIESSPFFINGTTIAPEIEIIIKDSNDIRAGYKRFTTTSRNEGRATFNQTIRLKEPGKYRIGIRMLKSNNVIGKKIVWITYSPDGI